MLYRRILPFVCLLIFIPLGCFGCMRTSVIEVYDTNAALYPNVRPIVPTQAIVHCYNPELKPFSHYMFDEVKKRFHNPVFIDVHGGDIGDEWYAGWDTDIFGPRIRIKDMAEQYLRKYKDCDIVLVACNENHHELILDVPKSDASRFWYFREKVWVIPDDKIPNWDAMLYDISPQMFFHETIRDEGDAGSIWEAVPATAREDVYHNDQHQQQPTTQPCTQPCK